MNVGNEKDFHVVSVGGGNSTHQGKRETCPRCNDGIDLSPAALLARIVALEEAVQTLQKRKGSTPVHK